MKTFRQLQAAVVAVVLLAMVFGMAGGVHAATGVDPSSVTLNLPEGGSTTVAKTVHTPPIPPKPDVLILADTTASMKDALSSLQTNLNSLVSQVQSPQPDAQFGIAEYRDFDNCSADGFAYRLDQAITANIPAVQSAVNGLSIGSGCDKPEQQLNALFQIANDNPPIGWRTGSTRIVAWFGDASGHDPSFGHTLADVITTLQSAQIRVIAIPISTPFGDGLDSTGQATAITSATGGSLVGSTNPSDVASAILAGLKNLPVTVTFSLSGCDPNLSVTETPGSQTVTSGTDATFTEGISVSPAATPGSTLTCTVNFLLNGNSQPGFSETITETVPKHPTTLQVADATSDFNDPGILSATLTDSVTNTPVAGATISFTMEAESCTGTTNASGVATCSIIPGEPAGTYPIQASFAGDAQHLGSTGTASYIVTLEESAVTSTTSLQVFAQGGAATLSSTLTDPDGGAPIPGKPVQMTLGSGGGAQSCTGTTDASGTASCTINPVTVALGPQPVTDSFAGDAFYKPATNTQKALVFAFPAGGDFVVGDKTASGPVTFWGAQWSKVNVLSGGPAPASFKGFEASAPRPSCGTNWTTGPGNSPPPPPAPLPAYMGVIASSSITQQGSTISGNTVHIVVVQTNPGYAPDPGHAGTGTVVASFC